MDYMPGVRRRKCGLRIGPFGITLATNAGNLPQKEIPVSATCQESSLGLRQIASFSRYLCKHEGDASATAAGSRYVAFCSNLSWSLCLRCYSKVDNLTESTGSP